MVHLKSMGGFYVYFSKNKPETLVFQYLFFSIPESYSLFFSISHFFTKNSQET